METLAEARAWVRANREEGVSCPCCGQFAKVYKRAINSTQARALAVIYRNCGLGWGHLPDLRMALAPHHSNEEPKLRYWNLLEEELEVRRDDGGRAGWWRVTTQGEAWLYGEVTVPKYAYIFNAKLLELGGPPTTIRQALGTRFNYEELMGYKPRDTFFDL